MGKHASSQTPAASRSSPNPKEPTEKISTPEESSEATPPPPPAANSPTPPTADTQPDRAPSASFAASSPDSVARPSVAPNFRSVIVPERVTRLDQPPGEPHRVPVVLL